MCFYCVYQFKHLLPNIQNPVLNILCIPESFITSFYHKITFFEFTNFNSYLIVENPVSNAGFKDYCQTNTNQNQIWYGEFIQYAFKIDIPPHLKKS